jgi:hypothetical protein
MEHTMATRHYSACTVVAALMILSGCATSPEEERERLDREADIDEIVNYQLDASEVGTDKNCLADKDYVRFRALGPRHLLFEGKKDKLWINVLRGRCSGLRFHNMFITKPRTPGRLCDMDRFEAANRSDPSTLQRLGTAGNKCMLGVFKPAVKAQVEELERRLRMR